MSRGMRVHEIFSSQNLPDTKTRNEGDGKDQGRLSEKKTLAPMPPMKRFGGYKPKILSGDDDVMPTNHHLSSPPPPTSPPNALPRPVLTKPKPFIIGDKNVPMILGTIDNDDDYDDDEESINGIDTEVKDLNIYDTVDDNSTNGPAVSEFQFPPKNELENSQFDSRQHEDFFQEHDNFQEQDELQDELQDDSKEHGYFQEHDDQEDLIDKENTNRPTFGEDFATDNPAFTAAPEFEQPVQTECEDLYLNNLHIPEPDYDEKEKCLNFAEEDPDDLVEYNPPLPAPPMIKLPPLSSRVYLGEDWSHYLSDDEEEMMTMIHSDPRKGRKSMLVPKVSQKHSLFKGPSRLSNNNNNNNNDFSNNNNNLHSKNKSKEKSGSYNSVRSFSYADSKFGTKGKSNMSLALKNHADDGDNFQDDSYESFLFSRHGHTMPSRISGASARDMGQLNGVKSDEDRLWKKLTFRLKNKRNKNGYAVKEM